MKFQRNQSTKKSPSSLFVGTSPAFDFALFSVCFISLYKGPSGVQAGNECTCKINKNTLTLKAIEKPTGSGKVCTVYPTTVVGTFWYSIRGDSVFIIKKSKQLPGSLTRLVRWLGTWMNIIVHRRLWTCILMLKVYDLVEYGFIHINTVLSRLNAGSRIKVGSTRSSSI